MRFIKYACVLILVQLSIVTMAQENANKKLVMFDPLFWKDQLNLKPGQFKRIAAINNEFYEVLASARRELGNDPVAMRYKLHESLEYRSEQIWNTFYPNQRKKWERIVHDSMLRDKI